MTACECCWSDLQRREYASPSNRPDLQSVMIEHEERGCLCTRDTLEGRRRAAGQFWNEDRQADVREHPPAPPAESEVTR